MNFDHTVELKRASPLTPGPINLMLTLVVLFLPILREEYNGGEYITWHRPIVVIVENLREQKRPEVILLTVGFFMLIYFIISLTVYVLSDLLRNKFRAKKQSTRSNPYKKSFTH